jgi:hypothetical protein
MSQRTGHLALVALQAVSVEDATPSFDRRAYERLTMSALGWLNDVKIRNGCSVPLFDRSADGAQIETINHRLQPGTTEVIEISGHVTIPSRVLRCHVSAVVPSMAYTGALQFTRRFDLPEQRANGSSAGAEANPRLQYARLALALTRLGGAHGLGDGLTTVGSAALAAVLTMIESPAGRLAVRE